jgi:hypothetical protein
MYRSEPIPVARYNGQWLALQQVGGPTLTHMPLVAAAHGPLFPPESDARLQFDAVMTGVLALSPDGRWLLFDGYTTGPASQSGGIYLARLQADGQPEASTRLLDPMRDFHAAWGPDGALWMVFRDRRGTYVAVAAYHAARGRLDAPQVRALLPRLARLEHAAFAFTGRSPALVLAAAAAGNDDLELYQVVFGAQPASAALRQLTDNDVTDDVPLLTPDGRALIWRSERDGQPAASEWYHAALDDAQPLDAAPHFLAYAGYSGAPLAAWVLLP